MALRCRSGVGGRGNCLSCLSIAGSRAVYSPCPATLNPAPSMPSPGRATCIPACPREPGVPALLGVPGELSCLLATSGPELRQGKGHPPRVLSHHWKPWGIGSSSSLLSSEPVSAGPPPSVRTLPSLSFPLPPVITGPTQHHVAWIPVSHPGWDSASSLPPPVRLPSPGHRALSSVPFRVPPSPLRSGPSSQFLAWRLPKLTPTSRRGLSPDTQLAASVLCPSAPGFTAGWNFLIFRDWLLLIQTELRCGLLQEAFPNDRRRVSVRCNMVSSVLKRSVSLPGPHRRCPRGQEGPGTE